jgi:exonuclease SbcC
MARQSLESYMGEKAAVEIAMGKAMDRAAFCRAEVSLAKSNVFAVRESRAEMEARKGKADKFRELPALREKQKGLERERDNILESIDKLESEMLAELNGLSFPSETDIANAKEEASQAEAYLRLSQKALNEATEQKGKAKAEVESLALAGEEIEITETAMHDTQRRACLCQTLEKAFSMSGIPAMVIENAVPELERVSNEILSQMSGGEHSLRFETQRELKSRDGMAETLDIIVSDWHGERPYETLSGGEALRCDLAIRIGLAEFLANRAGAKIEFIVADEVAASQDREHREILAEVFKSISSRFKKIFVVSHVEEFAGRFPQTVSVVKDEAGTRVEAV